ncbi:MAG: exo-alpha-sialidase [Bacteroidales bacterium]|nr:exo-alpha-sialidase [Bacteroidales bacterium]
MRKDLLMLAFALPGLLCSCQKSRESTGETTLIRATLDEARTSLSFPDILWSAEDAICVNGQISGKANISDGGRSATFALQGTVDAPYYALYPGAAFISGSFRPAYDRYGSVTLPAVQTCPAGNFDASAAIMGACSGTAEDPSQLRFSCLVAFLKIRIILPEGSLTPQSIEVSANGREDLCGDFSYDPAAGRLKNSKLQGKGITADCRNAAVSDHPVYIAIPAKTYTSGLTLKIKDGSRQYMELKSTKSFSAGAGKIYPTEITYIPNRTVVSAEAGGAEDATSGVTRIASLNRNAGQINSHTGQTERSAIEMDRRSTFVLTEKELGCPVLEYPRIKVLPDGRYILFYLPQRTGYSVYCSFSSDLEHWDGRHTVWAEEDTVNPAGEADKIYYADADMVVADNGDLLVFGTYRLKSGHKYLRQWGILMKRSKDMGKTWGDEQKLYTTCVWEPLPIKMPDGEILVFFTDSDHDWDPTITGISLLRSKDNGYTWTTQAPVMRFASGWAYPHQRSLDMPAPQGDSTVRWTSQMPAVVLLNDGQTCLICNESHTPPPEDRLMLTLGWENRAWSNTLTGSMEAPPEMNRFFVGGSGPYLAQFPSGETVLSYAGLNWYLRLGNETGRNLDRQPYFSPYPGTAHWGNLELENAHCMLGTVAYFHGKSGDPEYETVRDIIVARFYLNHRIDIPQATPVLDGDGRDWADNTDAFFLGSDTRTQCCFRFCYDDNWVYALVDCLNEGWDTSGDRIDLYFSDGKDVSSIRNVGICSDASGFRLESTLQAEMRTRFYPGEGYVAEIRIPRSGLPFSAADGTFFNAVLHTGDVQDTFNFRTLDKVGNWFQIRP